MLRWICKSTRAGVGGKIKPTSTEVGGNGVPTEQFIQSGRIDGKLPVGGQW